MTPDSAKLIFDSYAIVIMLLWGVACKYVPFLAKVPNATIGWVNLVGYMLTKFIVPDAHASIGSVASGVGTLVGGIVSAGWATVIYETFGRTLLEKWLKLKKAVPVGAMKS